MKNERLPHDASCKQIFSNPDMVASTELFFTRCGAGIGRSLARRRTCLAQLMRLERATTLEDIRAVVREFISQLQGPKYLHLRRILAVWLGRVVFKRAAQWKDEYIQ